MPPPQAERNPTTPPRTLTLIEKIRDSIKKFMAETPAPEPVAEVSKLATVEPSGLNMVDDKLVWSYQPKNGTALSKTDHSSLLDQLKKVLQGALQKYPVDDKAVPALILGLTIIPPPEDDLKPPPVLTPTSKTTPPVPGKSLPEAVPSKQE